MTLCGSCWALSLLNDKNFALLFFLNFPQSKGQKQLSTDTIELSERWNSFFIHHQRLKQGKNFYIPKGFLKGKIYRYIYYYTMYNFVIYFGIWSKSLRYFILVFTLYNKVNSILENKTSNILMWNFFKVPHVHDFPLCEERPHILFYGKVGFGHFSIFSLKIFLSILRF